MAENKNLEIENFLFSIDNMLNSKYILADRRIADILLAIAETPSVYNLIAECMINFDFKHEWKIATTTNIMKLPQKEEKRISFIFCLLNNIDDRNLDITRVLEKYFSYDTTIYPYELFCTSIIAEFKNLILSKLSTSNKRTKENEQIVTIATTDEFDVLAKLLNDFIEFVAKQKKLKHCFISRDDLIAIVSTFKQAVLERKVDYFYSYQVTINSAINKNKNLKQKFADSNKLAELIIRGSINER